jgi:hypothetical protein
LTIGKWILFFISRCKKTHTFKHINIWVYSFYIILMMHVHLNDSIKKFVIYRQWTEVFERFQFFKIIYYHFSKNYPEVNSHPISIIFISIKTELYVVLLYNFKIIFYDKHFLNIQAKHRKAERYVVYSSNFEITFWSMFFKSPWFKHKRK